MSRIFYNSQSQPIQLSHKLGTGGEGSVFEIFAQPEIVAKIYHEVPSPEKAEKLIALSKLSNERLLKIAAWPVDVLRVEANGDFAGFVMKRIGQAAEVHTLHSPKSRLQKFPEASWAFLIYVATNIARAVATLHENDFIVGDLNPKNILVTHQATVTLLDCDSFQVTTEGKTFRCEGGFPEYLPPELQGKSLRDVERTPEHDCFGLAVVIFQLLFMGRHPFSGRFTGAGEQTLEEAIRQSRFAFGEDAAARQMLQAPGTLSLEAIPASLSNLFRRAFLSADRPKPLEWIEPLESLTKSLKSCALHSGHHFFDQLAECPWCQIEMRARIRLFNFSLNGQNGKRSHFRLDQVWSEVEKLEAESVSLALVELKKDQFLVKKPSLEAADFLHEKRMKLIRASVLSAVVGFAIGYSISWPLAFLLIVFAGMAAKKIAEAEFGQYINSINLAQQRFSSPSNPLVNEAHQKFEEANRTVQNLESRLEKLTAANAFHPKLEELKNLKETYENLPQIREYRLNQLETRAHDLQLNEFLSQFEIKHTEVNGIGELIADKLRASGVKTAADLTPERLKAVPGIAEARAQRLLFWRAEKKRKFAFDPVRENLPQARINIERELDNLRMQLEHELSGGAMFLQRVKQEVTVQWQQSASALPEAYRQQSQAEKDWEAVSKRNPMWPLIIILLIAFLYGAFTSSTFENPWLRWEPGLATSNSSSQSASEQPAIATEQLLSSKQKEARLVFEKGEKEMLQENWTAASKIFEQAMELDPQFHPAYTQFGHALYRRERYDQSIAALTESNRIKEQFEAHFYLGMNHKAKSQWADAIDSFDKAIELNTDEASPLLADSYYNLGQVFSITGDIYNKINRWETDFDANNSRHHFRLGVFYLWVGKPELAKRQHEILKNWDESLARHLERLIKQHPKA